MLRLRTDDSAVCHSIHRGTPSIIGRYGAVCHSIHRGAPSSCFCLRCHFERGRQRRLPMRLLTSQSEPRAFSSWRGHSLDCPLGPVAQGALSEHPPPAARAARAARVTMPAGARVLPRSCCVLMLQVPASVSTLVQQRASWSMSARCRPPTSARCWPTRLRTSGT